MRKITYLIWSIIEAIKIAKRKASIVFADFSKVFDISTGVLCSTFFISMACQTKLLHVSKPCTTTQKHLFLVQMEPLTLLHNCWYTGGDTLEPYLFIIVVDYILRISLDSINSHGLTLQERKSTRHPSKHITDLDYADDIVLLSDQVNNAEILLQSLETAAHKVGLTLYSTKTQCY